MIEVAYAVHDYSGEYTSYLWVSMKSLLEHTKEKVNIHILCDRTLSNKNRKVLRALCEEYDQKIDFREISLDRRIDVIQLLRSGYNEGILFRLYLPELFPFLPKMIYLDSYLLFRTDIKELWDIDVLDVALAGRWDPPVKGYRMLGEKESEKMMPFWENCEWSFYINSGVLILNLDRMRRCGNLVDKAVSFFHKYGMAYPDQDVLNAVFAGQIKLIPYQYNIKEPIYSSVESGCIYHYEYAHENGKLYPLDQMFLDYWEQSPFYHPEYGKKEKIFYLRRLKSRLELYERLESKNMMDRQSVLYKAAELYRLGHYEECCDYLGNDHWKEHLCPCKETINEDEFQIERVQYLAQSLCASGQREEAAELLSDFLGKATVRNHGYLNQSVRIMHLQFLFGEILYQMKEYEKAEKTFLGCLFLGNQQKLFLVFEALQYAVKCAWEQKAFERAMEYVQRMLVLDSKKLEAKIMRLKTDYMMKKQKENKEDAQTVLLGDL